PPRNVADCVQRQRLDGCIRMRPCAPVEPGDLLSGLISSGPHVGVRFGVAGEPRQGLTRWSLEDVAEVSQLEARYMLDQAQEVRASWHHGATNVELREAVELPEQSLTALLQVIVKV